MFHLDFLGQEFLYPLWAVSFSVISVIDGQRKTVVTKSVSFNQGNVC